MTSEVVPFRRWHMAWLRVGGHAVGGEEMTSEALRMLETQNSWTVASLGVPVACGGTIQQWAGRHTAWAYLRQDTGPHMVFLTKAVRQKLALVRGRVEATVRCDFAAGHRWMRLLGFEVETEVLRAYGPEGEDHTAYVRFNRG